MGAEAVPCNARGLLVGLLLVAAFLDGSVFLRAALDQLAHRGAAHLALAQSCERGRDLLRGVLGLAVLLIHTWFSRSMKLW